MNVPTFDQIPSPALVTDRTGIIQSANQELLLLVGGTEADWRFRSMDLLFPLASRIFLQTHVWPMLTFEGRVREILLQLRSQDGKNVPVFVNCQRSVEHGTEQFIWILFVTLDRSRYEQELLTFKLRAEAVALDLSKSERFIRTVTDAMPGMITYWDTHLQCRFANQPYLAWAGKSLDELIGFSITDILGEPLEAQLQIYIAHALAGRQQEFERTLKNADGSCSVVLVNYIPDPDPEGGVKGFFALVTDISRLREADAAIRLTASVFEATTEGIMVTKASGEILRVNLAFSSLTGYSADELVATNARTLISGQDESSFFSAMFAQLKQSKIWKGNIWSKRKDGAVLLVRTSIAAICNEDGKAIRFVCVCADVTEQWNKEQAVRHMALHDGLTGLPNRTLLIERLGQLIHMHGRGHRHIVVLFLDLDGFKKVNDSWGHTIGDQVLKAVSVRLLALVRSSDTVARLGGDEFVILLDNPESRSSIESISAKLIAAVNEPMQFGELVTQVGASIGIAVFQNAGETPENMIRKADEAMYSAKALGKNRYAFLQPTPPAVRPTI